MTQFLKDWRDDLSAEWNKVLDGVEPDSAAVRENLTFSDAEPIFPGRKNKPIGGAPVGAHIFHALDGIRPRDVRVIVVGQDPYPKISQATGRSFEQGDLTDWPANQKVIADSLQRIMQVLLVARTGNAAYGGSDANWTRVIADRQSGALTLESPKALFDGLQKQAVLFLNAGLTLTRFKAGGSPEQLQGHIPLWRPIVEAILRHAAMRSQGQVVFVLWGSKAKGVFNQSKIRQGAEQAGTWEKRVAAVEHPRPNSQPNGKPFFDPPNSFVEVNRLLTKMGGQPIRW